MSTASSPARIGFDREAVRRYAHSRAGQTRGYIAEELNLPYEEVDRWDRERVEYHLERMSGTGAFREKQRERAQGPDRPDNVDPYLWEHMSEDERRETAERGELAVNERALRKDIKRRKENDESDSPQ